jgi:hypothetical protein
MRNFAAVGSFAALVALASTAFVQPIRAAGAQDGSPDTPPMMDQATSGHGQMPGITRHRQQMMSLHGDHAAHTAGL